MTPLERAYLYSIGILTLMYGATRGVNHWIGRLEQRYWEKQATALNRDEVTAHACMQRDRLPQPNRHRTMRNPSQGSSSAARR